MNTMHTTALPAASAPTHLRITRRGRAVLTTLAAIPIVAAAIFLAVNGASLCLPKTSRPRLTPAT